MVRNEDYIKKILTQILESYNALQNLKDQSGDLEIMKKELLKIQGFFTVLTKKIGTGEFKIRDLLELKSKIRNYLENYYFVQEIETMSFLYSDDPGRVKNMRLKILEAFDDRRLIDKIKEVKENL